MKKTNPVVSDTDSHASKRWYQKKHILIDVAVIIVVLVVIAVIWWVGHRPKPEPTPSMPQYTGQALVDEVNKRYGQNDYVGAIRLLEGQRSIKESSTQLLLAAAHANKGDYKAALDVYQRLEQQGQLTNPVDAATAGDIAVLAGNKQVAIDMYKKAIQRTNAATDPTGADQIAVYEAKITQAEKQQ